MKRRAVASLGAFLALTLGTASVSATDYNAPLSQAAAAFDARFAERDPICRQQSAQQLGISADRAGAFCACQLDVFARNATAKELEIPTKVTFGTEDEKAAARATRARDRHKDFARAGEGLRVLTNQRLDWPSRLLC